MKRISLLCFLLCVSATATADVTLKCEANNVCDSYLKNCAIEKHSFIVNIDPDNQRVTIGSNQIKADFSNQAEVSFPFTKYTYHINKHEYSAILVSDNEVRNGWCKKVEPAW